MSNSLLLVQEYLSSILPFVGALVLGRTLLLILASVALLHLKSNRSLRTLAALLDRILVAASIAGKLTVAIVLGWTSWDGAVLIDELHTCRPATAPRLHALIICVLFFTLLFSQTFWPLVTAYAGLYVASLRSPLAFFFAVTAAVEWFSYKGPVADAFAIAFYSTALTVANEAAASCGPLHHDAALVTAAFMGSGVLRWSVASLRAVWRRS